MSRPTWEIREGDALERLREMPDESVHCVVTSPPYWGLRDYGVPGQLGLEATPEEYVEKLVEVFREVRRVLRSDGVCWLNLGDSYNAYNGGAGPGSKLSKTQTEQRPQLETGYGLQCKTLKPKDLIGIPWRVALALQADGWWLRSDVIWSKPNPMPESVKDRPTKAHEYVFLLTRSERYFYDAEAIREPHAETDRPQSEKRRLQRMGREVASVGDRGQSSKGIDDGRIAASHTMHTNPAGRNKRTVWTIATQPYPEAHFATFPPELPRICIKAGTSEKGCCVECGAPRERVVEQRDEPNAYGAGGGAKAEASEAARLAGGIGRLDGGRRAAGGSFDNNPRKRPPPPQTTGWRPTCECGPPTTCRACIGLCDCTGEEPIYRPVPCVVLDPFAGAGTTGVEALALGRSFIGIELNPTYAKMARDRIDGDCPLFNREEAEGE